MNRSRSAFVPLTTWPIDLRQTMTLLGVPVDEAIIGSAALVRPCLVAHHGPAIRAVSHFNPQAEEQQRHKSYCVSIAYILMQNPIEQTAQSCWTFGAFHRNGSNNMQREFAVRQLAKCEGYRLEKQGKRKQIYAYRLRGGKCIRPPPRGRDLHAIIQRDAGLQASQDRWPRRLCESAIITLRPHVVLMPLISGRGTRTCTEIIRRIRIEHSGSISGIRSQTSDAAESEGSLCALQAGG